MATSCSRSRRSQYKALVSFSLYVASSFVSLVVLPFLPSSNPTMAFSGGLTALLAAATILVLAFLSILRPSHGGTFTLELHHKFSEHVRQWMRSNYTEVWPEVESVDYYETLFHHDRALRLRGRSLAGSDSPTTFIDGNMTLRLNSLGFLHYTEVEVGTPPVRFLVALDTGSDLLWVPCECISCASPKSIDALAGVDFGIYNPDASTTSKQVTCHSSLCHSQKECSGMTEQCPYKVAYVSANTSSAGVLIEDVLYLTTEDTQPKAISTSIAFGCGRVQTGSFLRGPAANGLFGLGMQKLSVPSILASSGLIANSFSMCFSPDGVGRINFGDKGSPEQEITPINVNQAPPTYNVTVSQIQVGEFVTKPGFHAIFDTGTSFTYLADPFYTLITDAFDKQANDTRRKTDPRIPFDNCYDMSLYKKYVLIPEIILTMNGGGKFAVNNSTIFVSTTAERMYCLAIIKSNGVNIIGQNFMTGYKIVFDREKLVLGWKQSECYATDGSTTLSARPPSLSPNTARHPSRLNPKNMPTRTKPNPLGLTSSSAHPMQSLSQLSFTTFFPILSLFIFF